MASLPASLQMNRRQNLEMAARCFFLSGSIFHRLAEEENIRAVSRPSTAPAPSPTPSTHPDGDLGVLTGLHIQTKPAFTIVPRDGSRRRFKFFVIHPAMLSEPYLIPDGIPGEYRVFIPDATAGNLDLKLMPREEEASTDPYVKRGPAQDEYHLHI